MDHLDDGELGAAIDAMGSVDEAVREAASTEEVASMIDATAESAEEVAEEIEQITAANEQQVATVNGLQTLIQNR